MRSSFTLAVKCLALCLVSCLPQPSPDDGNADSTPSLQPGAATLMGEENGAMLRVECGFNVTSEGELASVNDLFWGTRSRTPGRLGETSGGQSTDEPAWTNSFTLTRLEYLHGGVVIEIHGEYADDDGAQSGDAVLEVHTLADARRYFHLHRTISSPAGTREFDGFGVADRIWGFPEVADSLFQVTPPDAPIFTGDYAGVFVDPTTQGDETEQERMLVQISFDDRGRLLQVTDFAGGGPEIIVDEYGSAVRYVRYGPDSADVYLEALSQREGASRWSAARLRLTASAGGISGDIVRTTPASSYWAANWHATGTLDRTAPQPDFAGTYVCTLSALQITTIDMSGLVYSEDVSAPASFTFDDSGRLRRLTFLPDPTRPREVDYDYDYHSSNEGNAYSPIVSASVSSIRHLSGEVLILADKSASTLFPNDGGEVWHADYRIWRDGETIRCRVEATGSSTRGGPMNFTHSTWTAESILDQATP